MQMLSSIDKLVHHDIITTVFIFYFWKVQRVFECAADCREILHILCGLHPAQTSSYRATRHVNIRYFYAPVRSPTLLSLEICTSTLFQYNQRIVQLEFIEIVW